MQQRLDIIPRKLSSEELEIIDKLKDLAEEINAQKKAISDKKKEFRTRKAKQEIQGLEFGEVPATGHRLEKQISILGAQLKKMQSDYIDLENQLPQVTKFSLKQQSIFGA